MPLTTVDAFLRRMRMLLARRSAQSLSWTLPLPASCGVAATITLHQKHAQQER